MIVSELIELLKQCPQDLHVVMYYDGEPRLDCDSAFYFEKLAMWDNDKYELVSRDSLVLCEKSDVYNYKNAKWFFVKGKMEMPE